MALPDDSTTRAARRAAATLEHIGALASAVSPVLFLAIRVWLAQSFLVLQVKMLMSGQSLAAAFTGGLWANVQDVASSGVGGAVQALCPALLALGLMSRGAAVAMLMQVLLLRHAGWQDLQTYWAALLLTVSVFGPGPFSLDRLLAPGTRNSALPFVRALAAFYRRLSQDGAPAFLLILRVGIVVILTIPHGPVTRLEPLIRMMHAMAMEYMPRAPTMIATLPVAITVLVSALLLLGLGVRPVALLLLVLAPFGNAHTVADQSLYWALLLGVLLTKGAGWVSCDRFLAAKIRALASATPDPETLPHVVIVGGGFGGCAAARGLAGAACRVTLIDKQNYHLFQPLLYQVATAGLSPADIATPIRGMFRRQGNVRVLLGDVTGVDLAARAVRLGAARVDYDTLVLATGARHSYFGRNEWAGLAPGLKTIEDATAIRRRLLLAFEAAETAVDDAARAAWLTFVIVGGGPTGVELAGAIAELARFGMEGEFRMIDPATARVVLVQSGPRLLPAFPESLSAEAAAALRRLGVEVFLNQKADAVDETGVTIGNVRLAARTLLWAAGVEASPAAAWLGVTADRAARVPVGDDLRVAGVGDVFAVGDTCSSAAWRGRPVPGLAPAAKQAGAYVATVIRAGLRQRPAPPPFAYRHFGSLATIGRKSAVADFGRIRCKGALAWWLWGAAHVTFLVDGRSRAGVVLEWLWDYFTLRRGTRLIVGAGNRDADHAWSAADHAASRPPPS